MKIPDNLIRSISEGTVILVLGAGASKGATNPSGDPSPTGLELAKNLAGKFLGGQHTGDPLAVVAELAISENDLATVQEYIRSIFQDIHPASFHKLLPTFKWAALATTNYDLVIERAYESVKESSQELVPLIKNGDRIEEKLRSPDGLMYLKLHGCISRASDTSVPLILSIDQYVTHRQGRDRVFDHLKTLSYEHPLVFIGHSLLDQDIRQLLLELGETDSRPRYYTVTPNLTGPEKRLWESKRITPLEGTFEQFLSELDSKLTSAFRGVVVSPVIDDLPISSRFIVHDPGLSLACRELLENEVEYIRKEMPIEPLDARLFYRGFNLGWAHIEQDLDIRRDLQDSILSDVVLSDESPSESRFYVIKGHAGSGKSVLLQRIAWEAALRFDKLCLYMKPHGRISFESLQELSKLVDERIYLFIDDVGDHIAQTSEIISKARRSSIALTIITAERVNEWNMACEVLDPYLNDEFEVRYLSPQEIDKLLGLLEKHHALFRLEDASEDERRAEFAEKAGRQLLVALHEATLGKPFEEIIADEYAAINPELARLIYLGICFLNRYDVPVRAGIIARVYGIRFTDFKERFFQPLDQVIFSRYDSRTRDFVYVTRHPHIADIVVNQQLAAPTVRLDMYLQMINTMNIDYDADRTAFRKLVRGRSLLEAFPDHQMVEAIFAVAQTIAGEDFYLIHQMAIYEMNRPNGNLNKAADYLIKARFLAPYDQTVIHSLAELELRRAENAGTTLEFRTHLREAESHAKKLTQSQSSDSHGFHALSKIGLSKLRRLVSGDEAEWSDLEFSETIKEVEDVLQQGFQKFPDDSYLLDSESQLSMLLTDEDRAEAALHRALSRNPNNPFIATRLAKHLVQNRQFDDAIEVYKSALDSGVADKRVHFNYARLLIDQDNGDGSAIEYHLRRSFSEGDTNTEAQFWFARQLYLNGKIDDATERFRGLKGRAVNPAIKRKLRGTISIDGKARFFSGRVDKLEPEYGFVIRDGTADGIYLHITNIDQATWSLLRMNSRVTFSVGFNFWGATAENVAQEQ